MDFTGVKPTTFKCCRVVPEVPNETLTKIVGKRDDFPISTSSTSCVSFASLLRVPVRQKRPRHCDRSHHLTVLMDARTRLHFIRMGTNRRSRPERESAERRSSDRCRGTVRHSGIIDCHSHIAGGKQLIEAAFPSLIGEHGGNPQSRGCRHLP